MLLCAASADPYLAPDSCFIRSWEDACKVWMFLKWVLLPIFSPRPSAPPDADQSACRRTYCGRGRQCVLMAETGRAECVCQEKCRPSFVPVCGSDGRFYENHCEVYRTACLERRRIYVVHSKDCFFKGGSAALAHYTRDHYSGWMKLLVQMVVKLYGTGLLLASPGIAPRVFILCFLVLLAKNKKATIHLSFSHLPRLRCVSATIVSLSFFGKQTLIALLSENDLLTWRVVCLFPECSIIPG